MFDSSISTRVVPPGDCTIIFDVHHEVRDVEGFGTLHFDWFLLSLLIFYHLSSRGLSCLSLRSRLRSGVLRRLRLGLGLLLLSVGLPLLRVECGVSESFRHVDCHFGSHAETICSVFY